MTSPLEIEINPAPVTLRVGTAQASPDIIVVPGPPGPQGPPGAGIGFDHVQASPAATWIITHGFGYYPSVAVQVSGQQVIAEVTYSSVNAVSIIFASPQSGSAHLI